MMIEESGSGSGRPKKHVDPDPQHCFKEVLDSIEQHRLLSPLLVVSTLSTCPTATLGVVRFVTLDQIYVKTPNPKCRLFLKIDQ
jgi:hypothetical protein